MLSISPTFGNADATVDETQVTRRKEEKGLLVLDTLQPEKGHA